MKKFIITENDSNQSILNFIKKSYKETSLSVIYKWFRTKKIKLNKKNTKDTKTKINIGDEILVYDNAETSYSKENNINSVGKINIAYEDENILIVVKPHGKNVHDINYSSLDNDVINYIGYKNDGTFTISHAHRLDKPTAGLIMYPKNKKTSIEIYKYINNKDVISKYYLMRTEKKFNLIGQINGYIYYDDVLKRSFFDYKIKNKRSKECSQNVYIINEEENLYEVILNSGRKHQIRAIASFCGAYIINDYKYGAKKVYNENRIDLVAYKIKFNFDSESILHYLNEKNIEINIENFFGVQ